MFICLLFPAAVFSTEISSVVFTFDPMFSGNNNQSSQLFTRIKAAIVNEKNSPSLAADIAKDGAKWLLTKNFSGIQFAIIYPDNPELVMKHSLKFVSLLDQASNLPTNPETQSFSEKLLCGYASDYFLPDHRHISIETHGLKLEDFYLLQQSVEKLGQIYSQPKSDLNLKMPVIADSSPAIARVFTWNRINPATFFSAKFIGEKFCRELGNPRHASYEIIYLPGQLKLLLLVTGNEQELFQFFPRVEEFCLRIDANNKTNEWIIYAENAQNLLVEDSRDLGKKLLQQAWLKHFAADFNQPGEIIFTAPDQLEEIISMPRAPMHYFSRSADEFPRIIAARSGNSNKLADVAIRLVAEARIIEEIVKTLGAGQSLRFPVSLLKESSQTLLLQFYARNTELAIAISGIRSRILNHLALKNLVNELPTELSVSIAATSDVPPFMLRGWLQQGWPSDPAAYSWRLPSREEIAEVLEVDSEDALLRKWKLNTATTKARAELLALLISKGLYLNSFTLD